MYLRLENPKDGPKSGWITRIIENTVLRVVSTFVPKANPDFEDLFEEVNYWKIEIDLTDNTAAREIGFNQEGTPIVGMPFGENYGFWTDSQMTLADYRAISNSELTENEFKNNWSEFLKTMNFKKT